MKDVAGDWHWALRVSVGTAWGRSAAFPCILPFLPSDTSLPTPSPLRQWLLCQACIGSLAALTTKPRAKQNSGCRQQAPWKTKAGGFCNGESQGELLVTLDPGLPLLPRNSDTLFLRFTLLCVSVVLKPVKAPRAYLPV